MVLKRVIDLHIQTNSVQKIQNTINQLNGTHTILYILIDSAVVDRDIIY